MKKMQNSQISFELYLVSQFLLKLAEIWTRQSLDDLEEIQKGFSDSPIYQIPISYLRVFDSFNFVEMSSSSLSN